MNLLQRIESATGTDKRWRIGMVSSFMPPHLGGLEIVAETLFQAYARAGHEVRWIASRVPASLPARDGARVRVRCWNGFEEHMGIPWPVWGPGGVREVAALVKWADVLHAHDCLYFSSVLASQSAHHARKPLLLSQHIGFVRYRSATLRVLEAVAYRTVGVSVLHLASHVVFCTPTAQEFIGTLCGPQLKASSTILNGIDVERFRPVSAERRAELRQEFGLPATTPVAVFVGRLAEKKGLDILFDAAHRTPDVTFFIVGNGPLQPPPVSNLVWTRFIPSVRMETAYQAADLFLLPSHSEGLPLSLQEAMACGVPVITSQGQSFASWLEQRGACLTVARTAEAFCGAIRALLSAPEQAAWLARGGREVAVAEWGIEEMARRYLDVLGRLRETRQDGHDVG